MKTDTCFILLTQGQSAIVSAVDYDWLMQWKWYASKRHYTNGYRWVARRNSEGKPRRTVLMHREIAKRAWPLELRIHDHIDRNSLNNARENLRPCTRSQNGGNSVKAKGKSSRFKGVSWSKKTNQWSATIRIHGKQKWLGYFDDEEEAAKEYAKYALEAFREFAFVPHVLK